LRPTGLNRSNKALRAPTFGAFIDVMYEARFVRFDAGKAHLGAALHALRVFVETLYIVSLRHARTPSFGVLAACKLRFHNHYGKQPECALHRRCTLLLAITASLTPPVMGLCRGAIFFVGPTGYNPKRVVRQRALQRLRLIPRRAHPDVPLFVRRQDHWHGL
jgi:hypothetical protein